MTVEIGYWIIPLIITIITIGYPALFMRSEGIDPVPFIVGLGGVIVSLVSWLIWALLT